MSIALITGSCGLIGSDSVEFFTKKGFDIVGIDNNLRELFFGKDGSTIWQRNKLKKSNKKYTHLNNDIRNYDSLEKIFKKYKKNIKVIIHSAAQPSHDYAKNFPVLDFNVNATGTLNILELTRVYLTYENIISDKLSYKFQSDMQNNGDAYYMYIKNANVDLSLLEGTHLVIGLQGMNMFTIQEKTWGNRFISKSAMDENEWEHSADLGIGLSQSYGDISGSILFTNGDGYKSIANDSNEKISILGAYGEKRLDKNDGFNIGGAYSMLTYDVIDAVEDNSLTIHEDETIDASDGGTEQVIGVFGGFSGYGVRVGFDYNLGTDLNVDEYYGASSTLMSFYGGYSIPFVEGLSIMGRYDLLDPDTGISSNDTQVISAGLIYRCTDGLLVSPNMFYTTDGNNSSRTNLNLTFQCKF